jgi:hypothetical protein
MFAIASCSGSGGSGISIFSNTHLLIMGTAVLPANFSSFVLLYSI